MEEFQKKNSQTTFLHHLQARNAKISPIFHFDRELNGQICHILCVKRFLSGNVQLWAICLCIQGLLNLDCITVVIRQVIKTQKLYWKCTGYKVLDYALQNQSECWYGYIGLQRNSSFGSCWTFGCRRHSLTQLGKLISEVALSINIFFSIIVQDLLVFKFLVQTLKHKDRNSTK